MYIKVSVSLCGRIITESFTDVNSKFKRISKVLLR